MKSLQIAFAALVAIIAVIGYAYYMSSSQAPPPVSDGSSASKDKPREIAKDFIVKAPTFKFDGISESLNVKSAVALQTYPPQHIITIEFDSRHAGYGDRTGQALAQVITKHTAVVKVVDGKVISAILENHWDEINQKRVGN